MNEEILRTISEQNKRLSALESLDYPQMICDMHLALPMLRGLWISSVDSASVWYDISGHAHHLGNQGNPIFNHIGLVSYWDLDGVGDYFSRADEADLDITGTETYVAAAAQGLTLGGWFQVDNFQASGAAGFMSKWDDSGGVDERSYLLRVATAGPTLEWIVSTNGIASVGLASSVVPVLDSWYFIVGRFVPGTSADIYVNGIKTTRDAGIPGSIHSGTADFMIGSYVSAASRDLDGFVSCCFLCAAACSDNQIQRLYAVTKSLFGV